MTTDPTPLFATAAKRARDPRDFTFKTLGEFFADLHYRVENGEDIRASLTDAAEAAANDPFPVSMRDDDEYWSPR